jgi:hypothetical protein
MPNFYSDLVRMLDQEQETLAIVGPFLDAVKDDDLPLANLNWHDDSLVSLEWWDRNDPIAAFVVTLNIYANKRFVLYRQRADEVHCDPALFHSAKDVRRALLDLFKP